MSYLHNQINYLKQEDLITLDVHAFDLIHSLL